MAAPRLFPILRIHRFVTDGALGRRLGDKTLLYSMPLAHPERLVCIAAALCTACSHGAAARLDLGVFPPLQGKLMNSTHFAARSAAIFAGTTLYERGARRA